MQDRVPQNPGRVLVTPEGGTAPFYATLTRADNPTQEGDPLNKETLLKDTTAALYGLPSTALPDDIFNAISNRFALITQGVASITLTVKDQNGLAAKDVLISNVFDEDGNEVYTNSEGVATGHIAAGDISVAISGYADIEDQTQTVQVSAGGSYTISMTVVRRNFLRIPSSASYMFSSNVQTVDLTVGAAGGGGTTPSSGYTSQTYARGGAGGGMGALIESKGIKPNTRTKYAAVVGAGTTGNGGNSSFLGVMAQGGSLGGGGRGAYSSGYTSDYDAGNGADGTEMLYTSFTDATLYGGAGGGGYAEYRNYSAKKAGKGGSPGGADGGQLINNVIGSAVDGLGGGGPGGAQDVDKDHYAIAQAGARGGNGCIAIRMYIA